MKRIFLSSLFSEARVLFENYVGDSFAGKRVAFIPTAARYEEVNFYIDDGARALEKAGMIVDELDVSTATHAEVSRFLGTADVIYISGGNTFFLLQEIMKSGADQLIREHIAAGKLYIGESAGSILLSPNIEYAKDMDDCSEAPELLNYESLSILDFYPLPHYNNYPFQEAVDKIIRDYDTTLSLVPFTNTQAIIVDDKTYQVVSIDVCSPLSGN